MNARANLRHPADVDAVVMVDLSGSDGFDPQFGGLPIDESRYGVAALFHKMPAVHPGDSCQVKVGRLPAAEAEVRRVIQLDEDLQKVGFSLLNC